MKNLYLQEYTQEAISEAIDKAEAFFCFGNQQFEEKKKEGVKYVDCGGGLICPQNKVKELTKGLKKAHEDGIKLDIKENGLTAITKRELNNYECYYIGDPTEAIEQLEQYGITNEQVTKVFKNKDYKILTN